MYSYDNPKTRAAGGQRAAARVEVIIKMAKREEPVKIPDDVPTNAGGFPAVGQLCLRVNAEAEEECLSPKNRKSTERSRERNALCLAPKPKRARNN